ncbi:MAG: NAD-dependent protein deacetylase [Burkholderiaceae bacterium]|nr:NAD-dependent protein deacetylase [Burkholderiaceae bacterium]
MTSSEQETERNIDRVRRFLEQGSVVVLTGAGLSTATGIPDYRDREGNWKQAKPIEHQDFLRSANLRQRYWARSFLGWPTVGLALPTAGHRALAYLESLGRVGRVVTQNVDGLQQKAGSHAGLEFHGGLQQVVCLTCRRRHPRSSVQDWMREANPQVAPEPALLALDGDAHAAESACLDFRVPSCPSCAGVLKPDVVFFGDFVPQERVAVAISAIDSAHGMLVVGSSLMVYSGFRFVVHAQRHAKPVLAINLGKTRADAMFAAKIETDCNSFLDRLREKMT